MIKKLYILLVFLLGLRGFAQQQVFYMPYQMPDYAAVKFNTFLANPAFPLLGYKEQNVGLYYRSQWMGYKDPSFSLMGLSYGNKWNDSSSANAFIYKRTAGVMSNMGAVLNYGHQVFFSDEAGLRLGLNVVPSYSGLDTGKVVAFEPSDPLLATKKTMSLSASPGFDINYKQYHFGLTAQNIFDYAFGNQKTMTSFADKAYTVHFMWRKPMESMSGLFENSILSATARAIVESSSFYFTANALFDMPKLGWAYLGFNQKTGIFTGVGFNLREMFSIGVEYENGLGAQIPQLQHTFGVYANVQFGGERQRNFQPYKPVKKPTKPKEETVEKEVEQKIEPKEPPVAPEILLATRDDADAASVIPPGYYIIANVYQNPDYAERFKKNLSSTFSVSSFVHPKNGMTYVYIKTPVFDLDAATKFYQENKGNSLFPAGIWIMNVTAKKELAP